jgi:hypothetical protein
MADAGEQDGDIALLLTADDGGRMFAPGGQMDAIVRTVDFDLPLGRAAYRADRLPERRTRSLGFAVTADRTGHASGSHRSERRSNVRQSGP